MKIYLPTSSLNADNILSCESISPANKCKQRDFGYSQFETLKELSGFSDYTIGFTKIPEFSVIDLTRENYPMIVEIDLNEKQTDQLVCIATKHETDIYVTANPIIISPTNTKLLFFSRAARDYTFHNCADSAKCKLFDFFKNRFEVVPQGHLGERLTTYLHNVSIPQLDIPYSENAYNKVKGFIWGYGIGNLLSLSSDVAKLLRIQKRIYDIISSSKNDGYISDSLKEELENLDKEYSLYDPISKLVKSNWSKHLLSLDLPILIEGSNDIADVIDTILRKLNVEGEAKSKFLKQQNLSIRIPLKNYERYLNAGYEKYNRDIELHTKSALYQDKKNRLQNLSVADNLDVDTDKFETVTLASEDYDSTLFNKFLFRMIWGKVIPSIEDIRINRAEVARNVVLNVKSIIEELNQEWQGSSLQAYFDRMRKNISRYEPFNINDENNTIIKSIAAFVLKGEDFEGLKTYLENNAISDYRYSFALWGALVGYVSIPRALVENVLNHNEIAFLFNETGKVMSKIKFNLSIDRNEYPDCDINGNVGENVAEKNNETVEEFKDKVLEFFDAEITKRQKKDRVELLRQGLYLAFNEFGEDSNPIKFVSLLNDFTDYGWSPNNIPWQKLCAFIAPDYESIITRKLQNSSKNENNENKKSFFGGLKDVLGIRNSRNSSSKKSQKEITNNKILNSTNTPKQGALDKKDGFIWDDNAYLLIERELLFIPLDVRKKLIANLKYIQKNYRPDGYYAKRNDSKEDRDVIDHFIRWCTYENNHYNRIESTHDNIEILSDLKKLLINTYCAK